MSAARIVVLPRGELEQGGHPYDECIRCGASARVEPCHLTTFPGTMAGAAACDDVIGCERRRHQNLLREAGLP